MGPFVPIIAIMSAVPSTSTTNHLLSREIILRMAHEGLRATRLRGQMVNSLLRGTRQVQRNLHRRLIDQTRNIDLIA